MVTKREKAFETEAALCAAFIEAATANGEWIAYPETFGDILLVRVSDGAQIGIEAKMVLNTKVILQAMPQSLRWTYGMDGPDFRAVLVPEHVTFDLKPVCDLLGLTIIRCRPGQMIGLRSTGARFHPDLPDDKEGDWKHDWHEWGPVNRVKLPDYIPDSTAGTPSPITLTTWKIKAIKMAILLEERPVTRADFAALQLSPTRWMEPRTGWLTKVGAGWVWAEGHPDFRAQHPRNYDEIRADKAKWMEGLFKLKGMI